MTKAVSTRLPTEQAEELDKLAEEEHLDRATLIRKILMENIERKKIEKAAEKYRKGEASVEEAAEIAETMVWEMIDYLERENITSPAQNSEEIKEEIEQAREDWGSIET